MSNEKEKIDTEKYDPYKKYKDYKWEDPDKYKNGPVGDENRKCRDCLCCLILLIFIIGCALVALMGFTKGKPIRLLYGYDEDGKACGYDKGYEDYPYLYFYNVLTNLKKLNFDRIINAVCVKDCPTYIKKDYKDDKVFELECKPTKNNSKCTVEYNNYYQSKKLINRFCFPSSGNTTFDNETEQKLEVYDQDNDQLITIIVDKDKIISNKNGTFVNIEALSGEDDASKASGRLINWSFFSADKLVAWISDLVVTKYAIAASVVWSFIISMFFLLFLRCCAGLIVYLAIFLVLIGFVVLCVFFRMKYNDYKNTSDTDNKTLFEVLFWVFVIAAAIWLLFILVMCNRIRLAVALIKVTAKYVGTNCCIVFVPFLFFVITAAWIIYWIILSIYIYAAGEFDEGKSKIIATFTYNKTIRYFFWYHLFALFYIYALISSYSQFVYASSAVIWYFTHEKGTEHHNILKSFHRGLRYHLGSLAFGSLIIAIVRFIMFFIELFKKKVEATYGKKVPGKCYKCVICCLQCFLKCIGKTIEFINKQAFIMIAIKGDCFCTAAWEGFGLAVRNLGRFSVFTVLGKLFCIIGTIVICAATITVGYFVITEFEYFSNDLDSVVLPMICFAIIGLIIGLICMKVFASSGDALLFAFLVDEELNKGQAKAFPDLQKFMSDER